VTDSGGPHLVFARARQNDFARHCSLGSIGLPIYEGDTWTGPIMFRSDNLALQ